MGLLLTQRQRFYLKRMQIGEITGPAIKGAIRVTA
jgi:hypothetical protein